MTPTAEAMARRCLKTMAKDTLAAWLRDAHAMEKSTVDNQERLVRYVEHDPELKTGFERHLEQSRKQLERIEGCLRELGTDPSTLKARAGRARAETEARRARLPSVCDFSSATIRAGRPGWCFILTTPTAAELNRAPVPGGVLEYEVRGAGDPILLIHGAHVAGSFLTVMDEPALAGFTLIRYHRRGYAGSAAADGEPQQWIATAAADAAALLRHLDVDRAHIVGHSSGAAIALQLALDASEHAHSLVLLEPPLIAALNAARSLEADVHETDTRDPLAPVVALYLEGNPAEAVDAFMRGAVSRQWREEVAAGVPGGVQQAERDAATFFELELPAINQWAFDVDAARRINRPVLNIVGSESEANHHVIGGIISTWLTGSEDLLVPGVNHALHLKDPTAVAAAIAEFARRHPIE